MAWQNDSEIVCGYVLAGKLDPNAVNPQDVYPPYAHIITMKREGAELPDIVAKDFNAVDACMHAVERVNGTIKNPLDYLRILEKSSQLAKTSVDLKKLLSKADRGEEFTSSEVMAIASGMDMGTHKFIPLSEVEPQKVKFVRTGYKPLDEHTGGVPYACVTIIASNPGVGKSTLGLKIISSMIRLKENKKKKAAIVSLEMTNGQIHQRYLEISDLSKEEKDRILMDRIFNIHEICAAITQLATLEELCVVMIDFADLIVEGEQTEAAMGVIYRNLEILATKTKLPIILIAQLNRQTYEKGLPRIHHIRYSGLAEATARMILLIYNPNSIVADFSNDSPLPAVEGRAYIIVGKSNFGYKEGAPGAIVIDWDGGSGWGDKSHGYLKLAGV